MDTITPFASGFPLHEFPDLTDEVLFAFQFQINRLIYLNSAFEKVWDMDRSAVGSNLSLLLNTVHIDDRKHLEKGFIAIKKDKQKQSLEFRIVLPDKKQKWIRLKAYVSTKSNNEIVVGIATDITAEKNYGETLHKFNDKKNSILQILSHDLLGPLGNIQLSTFLLSENSKLNEDDDLMRILTAITNSCKRSVTMIRDLINSEFLQTSESAFVRQRIDIVEKITAIIEQYKQSPGLKTQRFTLITSSASLFINADESKFLQAINNLLSNSLKFTGDDGLIEVRISEPDNKKVLIKIQDNGIGIPVHLQPFLFDKFTKARRTGIHGEPSTGLGMSIIKTIIEWHNGRIWFESTEGKGTTFYVEIPRD